MSSDPDDARQRSGETKRRRTRAAILAAADEMLAEHGFDDTTVSRVAAAAGVSQAAFYHHFTGKGELAVALVADRLGVIVDPTRPELDGDPARAVDWWLDRAAGCAFHEQRLLTALLAAAAAAPRAVPDADLGDDSWLVVPAVPVLAEVIARGQQAGDFAAYPEAVDVARTLVHALHVRCLVGMPPTPQQLSLVIRTIAHRVLGLPDPPD